MEGPRPGGTAFTITVSPVPGKYALGRVVREGLPTSYPNGKVFNRKYLIRSGELRFVSYFPGLCRLSNILLNDTDILIIQAR